MGEDSLDEFGRFDARDDAQRGATHATVFDVDVEDALERLHRAHGRGTSRLRFAGGWVDGVGDDAVAVLEVRGEHAVVSGEMGAGAWHEGGEAGDEVDGVEHDMSGGVTEGVLDPNHRLVADVLEQRWNAKLEDQRRLERELSELSEATPALGADDAFAIRALGEHFASVWNDAQCPMTSKKRIARTLIEEVMVDLDESAQELHMVVHWHGGCHTAFHMPKPLSGGVAHKTALEDVELITRMARRYRDDQIARVLSKLGRRTGKGNRWTQSRVATVRRKCAIAPPDVADLDPDILTLGADEEGGDRPVDDAQDLGEHCGAGREQEP